MMKRGLTLVLLSGTLAFGSTLPASAAPAKSPKKAVMSDAGAPGFNVGFEFLFMSPRHADLDYAIPYDSTDSIGDVSAIRPGFDAGFRFSLGTSWDGMDLSLTYTGHSSDQADSLTDAVNGDIAGTLIIDDYTSVTQGSIELAEAAWNTDLHVFDLIGGYQLRAGDALELRILTGLKVVAMDQRFNVLYADDVALTGDIDTIEQTLNFKAYGLQAGLAPTLRLDEGLRLVSSVVFSPLLADVDRNFFYDASGTTYSDLDSSESRIMDQMNLSLGLEADLGPALLALGYEAQSWQNFPGFLTHTNESGEILFERHNSNFGYDGFYARLSADL
jgi:hypothetical protein